MRRVNVFFTVSCGLALVAACSSSSGPPSSGGTNDSGAESGTDATTANDDSGTDADAESSDSSPIISLDAASLTLTCKTAEDCADAGSGEVCCFSLTSYATSCVAGQCAAGDFQQCASTGNECPAGFTCTGSPLMMGLYYCAAGGDGGVEPGDTGTGDTGAGDGATHGDAGTGDGSLGSDTGVGDGSAADTGAHDGAADTGAHDSATD
jgi:hypothetical protein